jgi:hypothetical protein
MVVSELKMGLIYNNLYILYIHVLSTLFDFFNGCIIIACDKYFRPIVIVPLKPQLCCNICTMYIHVIMPCVHISTTHHIIHLQLIFDYDSH